MNEKQRLAKDEIPKLRKESAEIVSERYKTTKSIPLIFHFEPAPFQSPALRLHDSDIRHVEIEGGDVYTFNGYFLDEEGDELRKISSQGKFERTIYADHDSKQQGEEPAYAMSNQEKWKFFSQPPSAIKEIFKLLCYLADKLNASITTLPWELYDADVCVPTFATNLIKQACADSETLGKHEDYNTEKGGVCFSIPRLYGDHSKAHPLKFVNGEAGKPWLVTIMVYATSEDFLSEYGLGTVFCKKDGEVFLREECRHMSFVLFEGQIVHGVARSTIPAGITPWRVSYVLKLVINPKKENDSMKQKFCELIRSVADGKK